VPKPTPTLRRAQAVRERGQPGRGIVAHEHDRTEPARFIIPPRWFDDDPTRFDRGVGGSFRADRTVWRVHLRAIARQAKARRPGPATHPERGARQADADDRDGGEPAEPDALEQALRRIAFARARNRSEGGARGRRSPRSTAPRSGPSLTIDELGPNPSGISLAAGSTAPPISTGMTRSSARARRSSPCEPSRPGHPDAASNPRRRRSRAIPLMKHGNREAWDAGAKLCR
jgi:hypothetical protein